jgi:hypothetical protein
MPSYHHLDSRYARLTPSAIDAAIEAVRDANEVLFATEELSARELILVARSVLETERLYELDETILMEPELPEQPERSDWTYACAAEKFALAVDHLHERGADQAAERAQAQGALLLRRLAESPFRSALVDYTRVLRALIDATPAARPRERLELQRRHLAEDLGFHGGRNALAGLLEIGISHLQLGQHALGFDMVCEVLRHEPTALDAHAALAEALAEEFPELAQLAAQRALLLATRSTPEPQRAGLRAVLERSQQRRAQSLPAAAADLVRLLRDKPGKRVRTALPVLCESLVPEVTYVTKKHAEPLPTPAELAQLRRDLQTLPRTQAEVASIRKARLGATH